MDDLNSERVITPMPKSLVAAIDDFRFSNRIASRAEAIRHLIRQGLLAERVVRVTSASDAGIEALIATDHPARSVGPEDEARGGHEAPDPEPGPTVPAIRSRKPHG